MKMPKTKDKEVLDELKDWLRANKALGDRVRRELERE